VKQSQAVMVAADAAGSLVGTYYLRPNSLALGAHVANTGYVVAGLYRCPGDDPKPDGGSGLMKVVALRVRRLSHQPLGL
jgi:hypothetical protein